MPVSDVLEQIRKRSVSERDKGDQFEALVRTAFRKDRTYSERFSDVWLWMDWPDRPTNEPDIGIDLVARTRDGGTVAIQCKHYAPTTTLTKEDIDSFFNASGRSPFTERIIVSTTDLWSSNAEKSLVGQQIPVTRVGVDDLDAMTIEWDQVDLDNLDQLPVRDRHELRPHQRVAVEKVRAGFGESDRGKLIMACGTGKTFTGLRIAEDCGPGSTVLFLAPSIALVSQSLKEWTAECVVPIRPFAICSDATAGKPLEGEIATAFDLPIPPTTDVNALVTAGMGEQNVDHMTVVFSTYQSIQVVADVQAATGLVFDLVMCDEAHRTAGISTANGDDTAFVKVHDDAVIPARKRLYMTATPKIYQPAAQQDARDSDSILASMDDPEFFGPEFHRLGFGDAVNAGLLADYKVLILTVEEDAISESFQALLSQNGELNLPDVAKFIGCLTGLAKLPSRSPGGFAPGESPMKRAVAFWSNIAESQRFAEQFNVVAEHYNNERDVANTTDEPVVALSVPTRHVDGTDSIRARRSDIRWLKEPPSENECRVLTNARCLTEGVDVPALDAVMFLKPRRSKIDIVQAVGRVMRKPHGKDIGYIILPIAIPAGQEPSKALNQNPDYDVVWEVLQALRSHDERFNAYINRIALRENHQPDPDDPIQVLTVNTPATDDEEPRADDPADVQGQLFTYEDWTEAIYSKIVAKVGTRTYWEDWATDVAALAGRHEARINAILSNQPAAAKEFETFLAGLHAILNDSISRSDAVSMLSQHLITRPIFEALFGSTDFTDNNPVSSAMQQMVEILDSHNLETETESLEGFYESVRQRVEGIPLSDAHARQTIIKDLYGRFFKTAFPKVADSLGIVYTPVEVVDFIIRATQAALVEHFATDLSSEGVHVLDPFTGTGTFITRLLQSGFIKPDDLLRKYTKEIHANEILLLAYYIAAVNIETTFHHEAGDEIAYQPFPGIVYTDTFQQGEAGDGTGAFDTFPINNERADHQRSLDIRVIFGNPPYSAGQDDQNDNNQNLAYPNLDATIAASYVARSTATLKNSLYDSYVRALRWASNRIQACEDGGVVAFVTNGGFIDGNTADGIRLTLAREFHEIYIFNLRGNQRTAGEESRKEGGKIFDAGSRATVAISLLVKRPGDVPLGGAILHYRDVGDYLTREQKLSIVAAALPGDEPELGDLAWSRILPNDSGDWINQRSESFTAHMPMHDSNGPSIFENRTNGIKTNRDAWNYNSSRGVLEANVTRMIEHYNAQVDAFEAAHPALSGNLTERAAVAKAFVDTDPTRFSWDRKDFKEVGRLTRYRHEEVGLRTALYRPFHRRHVNAGKRLNNEIYQLHKLFPSADAANIAIGVPPPGASAPPFSSLAVRETVDNGLWSASATALFPLYIYEEERDQPDLFGDDERPARRDNITDDALQLFRRLDAAVGKEDIFYYVYGVLHSKDYRSAFKADLRKSLPRIPSCDSAADFWSFAEAGRRLAALHTDFESVAPHPEVTVEFADGFQTDAPDSYHIVKMKHPRVLDPETGTKVEDRSRIVYNEMITISGIPDAAHKYMLGSRSAIAWVIESFRVRTDKKSGITNNPNNWADEQGDPTYILDLVARVANVAVQTVEIVDGLPSLDL